jgi:predicted ester cyclase
MKNLINSSFAIVAASLALLLSGCADKGMPPDVRTTLDRYVGYWNSGRFDGIEDIMTDDFEIMESPGFEPQRGLNAFRMLISNTRRTYPDFRLEVNETVYEKDKIAFIWTVRGTNSGPGDFPPTGRSINGKGISVLHLRDGKIRDEWLSNNNLLFMMQLGFTLVPPPETQSN